MAVRLRLAGLIAAAVLTLFPAFATPDPERADIERRLLEAERKQEQAEARQAEAAGAAAQVSAELAALQDAVRSAAADLRRHEQVILQRTAELDALRRQQADTLKEWQSRRVQVGASVSALTRLASLPPVAVMLQDAEADARLRSAFVLRGLVPQLTDRARQLRRDLASLHDAAAKVEAAQAALVAAKGALEQRLAEARQVVRRKNALLAAYQSEAALAIASARRQAKSAGDLRELIARLEDTRSARNAAIAAERRRRAAIAARAGMTPPPVPEAPIRLVGLNPQQGRLLLPVTGSVARRFGEGHDAFSEGVAFSAPANAPVLAPADARIRYAGEFQNYGLVLILDHGGGFHSVLTGFERLNVVTDQWVLAGEPLGRLAPHGLLYVEIRENGRPVDPLQWFTVGRS